MNTNKHLIAGGLFALAMVGVGMASIPASVINVKPSDNYPGGITALGSSTNFTYRLSAGTHNWTSNNVYKLWGVVLVGDGAVLNIQPGTIIRGVPGSIIGNIFRPGMLIVERGGKIYANGTPDAPICLTDLWDNNFPWFGTHGSSVMQDAWLYANADTTTTNRGSVAYDYSKVGDLHGSWGGFVLCGKAFVNWDNIYNLGSGQIMVEGLDDTLGIAGGGTDDNDSSGEVSYFQVRYSGFALMPGKEINGFTLYGVGRNTKLHHIEVFNTIDDAFEWFGGCPNMKYLLAWGPGDDVFDSDSGFRGKNQFLLGVQRDIGGSGVESGATDKGMEIDGGEKDQKSVTYLETCSLWANVTLIGAEYKKCWYKPSGSWTTQYRRNVGLSMRDNASPRIYNSIIMDFGSVATLIENKGGADLGGYPANLVNASTHFVTGTTPENFTNVTCNSGATAGMDAAAVKNYLYGDGCMGDDKQACIRGCYFYNCTDGIAYTNTQANFVSDFGTAASGGWCSSTFGSGPWVSAGLFPYNGFATNASDLNNDLCAVTDATPGYLPIKKRARVLRKDAAHPATSGLSLQLDGSYITTNLDPRADGFCAYGAVGVPDQWLTPVRFVGAMAPDSNWAKGWTLTDTLGLLAASPTNLTLAVGGTVSAPLTGTTSYITNTVTTVVTNGVNGISYQANGSLITSGTGVTAASLQTSPVLTYSITSAGTYQLQTTVSLSPVSWTAVRTFTVASASAGSPVTVNLTDIIGSTSPNSGDSRFYQLIKQ